MIEAVNSVLGNASSLRAVAEQVAVARAVSASVPTAEAGGNLPKAPYISPFISVDPNYNKAVLQIRDSDTGDVLRQFPTEVSLEARRVQEAHQQERSLPDPVDDDTQEIVVRKTQRISSPPVSFRDVVTLQDATSKPPANSPQTAVAALASGALTSKAAATPSAKVSVLA